MIKTKEIAILGRPIQLQERSKAQMEGATIGDLLTYKFYDGEFHGMPLLFAEPKGKVLRHAVCLLQQTTSPRCYNFLSSFYCQLVLPMNGRGSSTRTCISLFLKNMSICQCFWQMSAFVRPNRLRL